MIKRLDFIMVLAIVYRVGLQMETHSWNKNWSFMKLEVKKREKENRKTYAVKPFFVWTNV